MRVIRPLLPLAEAVKAAHDTLAPLCGAYGAHMAQILLFSLCPGGGHCSRFTRLHGREPFTSPELAGLPFPPARGPEGDVIILGPEAALAVGHPPPYESPAHSSMIPSPAEEMMALFADLADASQVVSPGGEGLVYSDAAPPSVAGTAPTATWSTASWSTYDGDAGVANGDLDSAMESEYDDDDDNNMEEDTDPEMPELVSSSHSSGSTQSSFYFRF
jgi:hypothetical protein